MDEDGEASLPESPGLVAATALRSDGLPDSCCSQGLHIGTTPSTTVCKPPVYHHSGNRVDPKLPSSSSHHRISHVADHHFAGLVGQAQDERHRPVAQ